ncbi:hypothetical protein ABPG74_007748 [Tetrahymena malaccensis]
MMFEYQEQFHNFINLIFTLDKSKQLQLMNKNIENEFFTNETCQQLYMNNNDMWYFKDTQNQKNFLQKLPDIETKFIDNFKKQFNQFLKSVQENQNELTKNKIQMGEKILKYYLQIVNSVQSTQNDFQLSESQKKVNIIKTVNDQLKQQSYEKDKITLQNMLNKTFKFDNLKPFQQLMQDLQSIILYETNEKFELYSKKINKQYVLNQNLQLTNQTDKIQKGSKIDKIMNLILNNTNNCNQTCFNSFTNQFLDIEDLVESLEFPNKENSPKNAQINDNNEGLSTTKNNQQNQTNQLNLLLTNNNLSSILSYLDYDDQQTYSKIKKFYKLLNSTMFQRQSDSFLNDVIETLNKIQNNQNRLIEETIQNSIEYLQYSNQQFGSKEFQQVLQNSSLSHDEKKTRIQQMYFQNLAQKTKHQQHQILENSQKLDLDQQNILKESILLQLDLISQESTNKMLTHSQNIKQYFKNIILKQKSINQLQKGSNVEKIINLITTNENLCDKNCTNSFSDYNDDQMLIQDIKQVYGYKLENSVSQQFKKFFEILQQNFNETINNFINKQNKQFDDITQVVGEIIDSLNFPNDECQLKKSQVYFDLSSLNEDQQIHLQILISKMQEFNDIYKQKYGDIIHSEIDPQIQLSSHNFIEYLLNNKMINREKIVKIKQLLRIFPILDFENFYLLQTHQNTKFEISNHNKAYGQLKVFRSSESSAYFVKIFQNKTYELILGFGISNHICFGFQIQQKIFNYQIDGIYYYSNESACNRLLIQKGKCLETKFLDKYSHLQVKINVQKQFIQISDYPSNENINILNKEQFEIFQINAEYYFSIGLFYNTQGVSEIQIVEFKEIQE